MQRRLPATSSLLTTKGMELLDIFRYVFDIHLWMGFNFFCWIPFDFVAKFHQIIILWWKKRNRFNEFMRNSLNSRKEIGTNYSISKWRHSSRLPSPDIPSIILVQNRHGPKILHQHNKKIYVLHILIRSLSPTLTLSLYLLSQSLCVILFLMQTQFMYRLNTTTTNTWWKRRFFRRQKKSDFYIFLGSAKKKYNKSRNMKKNWEEITLLFLWANTRIAQEEGVEWTTTTEKFRAVEKCWINNK